VGTRFSVSPDRLCSPPSLQYNEYRVFPWSKVRPGRAADHSPPSSAAVIEEYSYTSTHPLGHTGPVTGTLYLLPLPLSFTYTRYVAVIGHNDGSNVAEASRSVKTSFLMCLEMKLLSDLQNIYV